MKLTKRRYELELTRLIDEKAELLREETALAARYDAGERLTEAEYNRFDEITDLAWDISQDITRLEFDYSTRKWTAAEWNSHNLMAQNID